MAPNIFLTELIKQGAQSPIDFDQSILGTPMEGDFPNQPILNTILSLQPTTCALASTSNTPISQPPRSSTPIHNSANYINARFPPISAISTSRPLITSQIPTSSYQYIGGGIPNVSTYIPRFNLGQHIPNV